MGIVKNIAVGVAVVLISRALIQKLSSTSNSPASYLAAAEAESESFYA